MVDVIEDADFSAQLADECATNPAIADSIAAVKWRLERQPEAGELMELGFSAMRLFVLAKTDAFPGARFLYTYLNGVVRLHRFGLT